MAPASVLSTGILPENDPFKGTTFNTKHLDFLHWSRATTRTTSMLSNEFVARKKKPFSHLTSLLCLLCLFGTCSSAIVDREIDGVQQNVKNYFASYGEHGYHDEEPLTEWHRVLGILNFLKEETENEQLHSKTDSSKIKNANEKEDDVEKRAASPPGYNYRYHDDTEIKDCIVFLLDASDPEEPRFCQIAFGNLLWTSSTSYSDLMTNCLSDGEELLLSDFVAQDSRKIMTIAHEVSKTGSTSVRLQIFSKLRECDSPEAQKDHPGFFHCHSIPDMMATCPDIQSFMFAPTVELDYPGPCFDYSPWNLEEDHQFIHTIAFREFSEWAHSAMNQVIKEYMILNPQGNYNTVCESFREQFTPEKCQGWYELSFVEYTKPVLRSTLRESPESHTILVHHYQNSTFLQTKIRESMGLQPLDMSKELNSHHINLTCPDDILESFHACFDHLV